MKTCVVVLALLALLIGGTGLKASAGEDHPTIHAAHRYAHRKAAHAAHNVYYARAHFHNWKSHKGHKIRAWLNNH